MAILIDCPTRMQAAGNKPKLIDEFIGRVNSGMAAVSIARMQSPSGWQVPGQTPEFDEYTVVSRGDAMGGNQAGAVRGAGRAGGRDFSGRMGAV